MDVIYKWHDLPQSARREIAARYGVSPQGAKGSHLWTMTVIEAATARGQLEQFNLDIVTAHEEHC